MESKHAAGPPIGHTKPRTGQDDVIPRSIGHIWIGPLAPPNEWMESWKAAHPDWTYRLFDNDYLTGRRFRNQAQINEYFRRGKYAGVSDLMRYEILYEMGGFLPEADSICLHPVDDLFTEARAYSVYEFPEGRTGMLSPFLACEPGNPVIGAVIDSLSALVPDQMEMPWTTTGNGFLRNFLEGSPRLKAMVKVFPSHYFIPEHYKGESYSGPDRIYARQMWGTTTRSYPAQADRGPEIQKEIARRKSEVLEQLEAKLEPFPKILTKEVRRVSGMKPGGPLKVLFCGGHPDDAEIYAYGTMIAYLQAGAEVAQLMVCKGDGGLTRRVKERPIAEARLDEARAAAAMIGAELITYDLNDGTLAAQRAHLVELLMQTIAETEPDIIITHAPNDYHPDHRVLSAAVTLAAAESAPVLYADTMKGVNFSPTHYVNVTKVMEQKLRCLRQHQSQWPRRYVMTCKELCARRGKEATGTGDVRAEAFRADPTPSFPKIDHLLPPGSLARNRP